MKLRDVLARAKPLDDNGLITIDEYKALERFYRGNGPQPAGVVAVCTVPHLPYHTLLVDYGDGRRAILWAQPDAFCVAVKGADS